MQYGVVLTENIQLVSEEEMMLGEKERRDKTDKWKQNGNGCQRININSMWLN